MEITVRAFEAADRSALIALWQRCGLTRPWNDPDSDIDLAVAAPDAGILIGEMSGEPLYQSDRRLQPKFGKIDAEPSVCAGTLVASLMLGFDGHRGWVYYFAVDPAHRRRGLGRRMMAAAEGWMEARGVPKIHLMVRDDNPEALGFYVALGYEVQKTTVLRRRLDGRG